jgi:hypothetical protein
MNKVTPPSIFQQGRPQIRGKDVTHIDPKVRAVLEDFEEMIFDLVKATIEQNHRIADLEAINERQREFLADLGEDL